MGAWLPDPFADQNLAGGILWASGDLVGLSFFVVLFVQWVRSVAGRGAGARTGAWTCSRHARPGPRGAAARRPQRWPAPSMSA